MPAHADVISGTVTDADDHTPIANVKVGVAANIFTFTGADGTYTLNTDNAVGLGGANKIVPPQVAWDAASGTFSRTGYVGRTDIEIRNAAGIRVGAPIALGAAAERRFSVPTLPQGLYFVRLDMGPYAFEHKIIRLSGMSGFAFRGAQVSTVAPMAAKVSAANTVTFERTDYTSVTKPVTGSATGVDAQLKRGAVAVLDNGILTVQFTRATEKVTVTYKSGNKTFLEDGALNRTGGNAKVVDRNDSIFGAGQSIEIAYAGGNINRIMLYPNLPFALFQTGVNNATAAKLVQHKVPTLTGFINNIGTGLKALGTQSLTGTDQKSYSYIAVADPANRNGVVGGWITHDRGNGVVFVSTSGARVQLDAHIEYGTLNIRPNTLEQMEVFGVGYFDDARLGMEAWADNVAKEYNIHLRKQPNGFVTWYSDICGRGGDQTCVPQLADWIKNSGLENFGFNFIQIDDYWQAGEKPNGPAKNFNTVDPAGPYSNGMKPVADKIKADGLTAGIWFMPFSGDAATTFFAPHQDWFAKGPDGKIPVNHWADNPIDITNAGAAANLTGFTSRMSKEWGFKYFKMDGLYFGMAGEHLYTQDNYADDMEDATQDRPVSYSDPYVTPIEHMRKGLKMIRQAAGDDVFFLGCSLIMNLRSLSGAVGLVDAERVGPDNNTLWTGNLIKGPAYGTKFFHFNNRLWYNDPDPVYLRSSLPVGQARAMCSWAGVTGQFTVHSDWLPNVPADRLDMFKRVIPSHGLKNVRPVDIFDRVMASVWHLTDDVHPTRRDVVLAMNWDPANVMTQTYTMDKLGFSATDSYVGFDFWGNKFLPAFSGSRTFVVPPADCQVIAVRKATGNPMVISTNRHVTQGIIDIAQENWDATGKTLSGTSHVVAGDAYELRIVTAKSAGGNWAPASVAVSAADKTAGVTIDPAAMDGVNVRVKIHSAANRDVNWSITFN